MIAIFYIVWYDYAKKMMSERETSPSFWLALEEIKQASDPLPTLSSDLHAPLLFLLFVLLCFLLKMMREAACVQRG